MIYVDGVAWVPKKMYNDKHWGTQIDDGILHRNYCNEWVCVSYIYMYMLFVCL